jgi:hypothetical protein
MPASIVCGGGTLVADVALVVGAGMEDVIFEVFSKVCFVKQQLVR